MQVKSMRGVTVNMGQLMTANASRVALGNAGLNARGDKVDRQGRVVASREQLAEDYNRSNPRAVKQVSLANLAAEVMTPGEAAKQLLHRSSAAQSGAAAVAEPPAAEAAPPKRARALRDEA